MAKIEHIEILMVDLVPEAVRSDAIQSFVSQETPIVRIRDSDGVVGSGYSYTIGTGGYAVVDLIQRHLAPRLIGQDANHIEAIWKELLFLTHATSVGAITSLALAAIDTALWDLRCRKTNLPLHLAAGGAQQAIPLYTTEGGWLHIEQELLVEDALRAKETGFSGSKVKVGKPSAHEDYERLTAVREAVGPEFEIMVDANQAFQQDDAIRRAERFKDIDLCWMEEPLPADDITGHSRLAKSTNIPIAVGESLYSISHFREYMASGACSVVQVDVARIGGITPWLKVAHTAEAFNLPIAPHFLMELHVSLVAAIPNGRWVEYIPQLSSITGHGIKIRAGNAIPPSAPGLGIDWDWDKINNTKICSFNV